MTQESELLALRNVSKSYGPVAVLHDVNLSIRDGEFLTVLGPSGSGKTTVLRLIAGLEPLTAGEIRLDRQDISRVPINRRPFNTVFQDYALFPHLTVADNVGYGLSVRHVARKEIARRVGEAIDMVQLGRFADRFPSQLSGGQKQRVALARALICQPRLVLLDEPLAALDLELRRQMQEFLKSIQREIKTTFLFVTHDQEEAIGLGDRICVMQAGRIQQLGVPEELYYRPNCEFVARFFGDNNLVAGTLGDVSGDLRALDTPLGRLVCSMSGQESLRAAPAGTRAFATIRPEAARLNVDAPAENVISGVVSDVAFAGASTVVNVLADGGAQNLRIRTPSAFGAAVPRQGDAAAFSFSSNHTHLVLA